MFKSQFFYRHVLDNICIWTKVAAATYVALRNIAILLKNGTQLTLLSIFGISVDFFINPCTSVTY